MYQSSRPTFDLDPTQLLSYEENGYYITTSLISNILRLYIEYYENIVLHTTYTTTTVYILFHFLFYF